MNSDKNIPRLLGAAFLTVVFTSLSSGMLCDSIVGSGSISDILVNISHKPGLLRISILGDMANGLAIVILAVLLYTVLSQQNRILALIALGWWLVEAIFDPISRLGAYALIPLSIDFVKAGAPTHSIYQTLGEFLFYGVARQGYMMHMFFYCAGGVLWYYLFYQSRLVPRAISLFGLIAVIVSFADIVLDMLGFNVSMYLSLPLLPFELTIGTWLLLKGINEGAETKLRLAHADQTR